MTTTIPNFIITVKLPGIRPGLHGIRPGLPEISSGYVVLSLPILLDSLISGQKFPRIRIYTSEHTSLHYNDTGGEAPEEKVTDEVIKIYFTD